MTLMLTPFSESLAERLGAPHPGVSIYWLGQAGFVIATNRRRIVIDPYLSDSLGRKYRGKRFAHERLMPAPIAARDRIGVGDARLVCVDVGEKFSALKNRSINAVPAEAIDAKSGAGDCSTRVHRAKLSVEYRLVN